MSLLSKRPHHRENSSSSSSKKHHHNSRPEMGKPPTFVSYLEIPNLPPKIKLICEIVAQTPSLSVEKELDDTRLRISQEDVEEVLKLSYGYPAAAVKFFRWAGYWLNDTHSPYSWNLVVDLLGKNLLFDAMWDAIKSMKKEGLLSLATFASVFSSYVTADKIDEALMTFEVMDQYGCRRDIVALNSLMSAICRDRKTARAVEFLRIAMDKIRPDADTYAILLEGWEAERNVASAKHTFGEMVVVIGWDPTNIPAYDSFLCTLIKGPNGINEAMKFFNSMTERNCGPGLKFFKLALEECSRNDNVRGAALIWEAMAMSNALRPDSQMYNYMISLYCNAKKPEIARRFLDEMVFDGFFPDARSYDLLLLSFINAGKLHEASSIFAEMVKNEHFPSQSNCSSLVKINLNQGDPYMAIRVWKFLVENPVSGLEEIGNSLVSGLRDLNMLQEAVKYANDMIDRKIKLDSSTLSKLKQSLIKERKGSIYDELLKKWMTY
ncbi:hypothetical protein Nepgr_032462 [Nepenthes gracilis]|uniref:Pentatricopeptide repeat-containing protein n=1 Tax=Nepenthes gracilis TaxID=150966 RepID=A0AAD3TK45_NEPGR|nr:hypothetical protein Nepgr_032462 [Nepenthes gracilis]